MHNYKIKDHKVIVNYQFPEDAEKIKNEEVNYVIPTDTSVKALLEKGLNQEFTPVYTGNIRAVNNDSLMDIRKAYMESVNNSLKLGDELRDIMPNDQID